MKGEREKEKTSQFLDRHGFRKEFELIGSPFIPSVRASLGESSLRARLD